MALQASYFLASGESQGKIDLPEQLFGSPGSRRVLHEAIMALQANQRRGTSMTKTRGLVRGGGRKPWKQKGTGNARSGSIRSPLWRKGGIIFGPSPRSYRIEVDEAKRYVALQTALVEKAKVSELHVMDEFTVSDGKTRSALAVLNKTGLTGKILLVIDKKSVEFVRALRNIKNLCLVDASSLNAWDVLRAKQVVLTKHALDLVGNRFAPAAAAKG